MQSIHLRQIMLPPHGQLCNRRHTCQVLQHLRAGREQTGITPEFVQHKTPDQFLLCCIEHCPRAVKVRNRPAPVNVSHQQTHGIVFQR